MEWEKMISLVATQGLGVVLSIIIIVYVLRENTKREERLVTVIEKHLVLLDTQLSALSKQFSDYESQICLVSSQVIETNKYQRDEHLAMMRILHEMLAEVKAGSPHHGSV